MKPETVERQISGETKENMDYNSEVKIVEGVEFWARYTWGRIYPVEGGVEAVCSNCGGVMRASNVEELKSVIAAHDKDHVLLGEYVERVAQKVDRLLGEEFDDKHIHIRYDKVRAYIEIGVGDRFMEISEAVGSGVERYCVDENLSDEECMEFYEDAYARELESINEEHAVYVAGVITLPFITIEFTPKEVVGDYDWAGLLIEVTFTDIAPWRYIEAEILAEQLVQLVAALYRSA
jgi:hypothetical protein